uniref:Odorant receptor n=1 Tax=Adelphocoris lineolatus TaxID=236346 RepID=A0A2I4PHC6_ADELI|nr:olfactory receptor 26 [Adelphocoris lineolatus]
MEDSWLIRYFSAGTGRQEYERIQAVAIKEFTPLVVFVGVFLPTDRTVLLCIFGFTSILVYSFYTTIFTYTCIVATDDFVLWSEIIHHTSLMYLGVFIRTVFMLKAQDMFILTQDYVDGVYNYEEGYVDPIFQELKDKSRALQRKLIMLPLFIVAVTGMAIGLKPYLDYVNEVEPHPDLMKNGVNFNSLVPVVYPFENANTYQVLVMNCVLLYFALLVILTVIAADILFIRVSCRISLEIAILVESLNLIGKRARRLYARKYGLKPPSKKNEDWPLYQDCISTCLKENIVHHQNIIKFYESFSAIAAPAIGGGFFTCTIVLGLGMIVVNMDNVNISDQIAFTGTVFAEMMNAFMISWMSEKIGEQNYELYNAVYGLKWFKWRRDNKKLVITILDGTREPLFLNAFGLAKINMEAFGSVVNTAYSFLNLVNASETLEEKK